VAYQLFHIIGDLNHVPYSVIPYFCISKPNKK